MEFHDAANFLFDLRRFRPKPGTESTADLLAALDDPQEGVEYVQIAGSNGKGSTAKMTESILREAGLTVGLYTSPHFDDVRERVQVDGRPMTKGALATFVERVQPHVVERAAAGEAPTFFEVMTAMALWEFGRRDVDVAVLEVGIGGRYDATSVIDPVASAVTSVTLEHTGILGDTVAEIARDKAHVAPAEGPLVTAAEGEALSAVREQAGEVLTVGSKGDVRVAYGGRTNHVESRVTLAGPGWDVEARIPLLGAYQARNAGIAAALARRVTSVSGTELERGLRNAHWPGRFEVMGEEPLTVLDGAHNPGACEALAETLAEFEYDDLFLVVGAMHEKDHRGMAAALPAPDHVVCTQPDLDRAEDREVLARVFAERGVEDVKTRGAVSGALSRALSEAGPEDCVLVAGSLFAVAEARERWTRAEIEKRVRDLGEARSVLEGSHVTSAGVWRMRGKAVHRVLKTRVQRRQAQYLKEEMLSLGGECAQSGLNDQDEETIDVVLMGTLAQFKRLCEKLEGQPYGLPVVARNVREALGIGVEPTSYGYPWEDRTAVMGILNVTPDSFHDGGEYERVEDAVEQAERMVENDVDVIDVGGESTRPGADVVPVEEEIERIVPVIERISDLDALISVDTRKAAVARAAMEAGADILNDVSGLEDPEMRFVAAEYDAPLIVMHSLDAPVDPDREVAYDDVVEDVINDLAERVLLAEKAGLDREQIIVDPGLGFAKSAREGFEILGRVEEFHALGCPVLIGHSHKSMFDRVDRGPENRTAATVAGTAIAAERGADIVRVHDVPENVAAVRTVEAANGER
ncbi:dihydropteroate synthase [Halalkalicoccus jeotgali]|uniref:Probable bifunctional folylpolyglutamate synthase/dihydropteroate synthase n=1 Tax=Halalkalicoccus jeotgali (strain DSM 18796 / CECT 7217 / JCM 14584 / KCTC 4019 / B3) TaxID=795797 RepID=D8J7W3_HALJB|nr:dihydropteroate synthase [Halalkalicoccus jeotgali]ADJ16133.1 dihydropteroate synthase [Halalkalicoccus jeotgali B3]ELY37562.1 dihydropteroate synthase [Halalkalicoccus jeotgali B3]